MDSQNKIFPECIICYNPLLSNLITLINCGHVFHEQCYQTWIFKGNKDICPLCKKNSLNKVKLFFEINCNNHNKLSIFVNNQKGHLIKINNEIEITNDLFVNKIELLEKTVKDLSEKNEKLKIKINEIKKYMSIFMCYKKK